MRGPAQAARHGVVVLVIPWHAPSPVVISPVNGLLIVEYGPWNHYDTTAASSTRRRRYTFPPAVVRPAADCYLKRS